MYSSFMRTFAALSFFVGWLIVDVGWLFTSTLLQSPVTLGRRWEIKDSRRGDELWMVHKGYANNIAHGAKTNPNNILRMTRKGNPFKSTNNLCCIAWTHQHISDVVLWFVFYAWGSAQMMQLPLLLFCGVQAKRHTVIHYLSDKSTQNDLSF